MASSSHQHKLIASQHLLHANSSPATSFNTSLSLPSPVPGASVQCHANITDILKNSSICSQAYMALSDSSSEDVSTTVLTKATNIDDFLLTAALADEINDNVFHFSYLPDSSTPLYQAFVSSTDPVVFTSITSQFNCILDLGCTIHII